jgi:carbon-monoxide dehydrogenase medium subunit
MKLPNFEYAAPTTLDDAIRLLAASGGTAKAVAGGQSLLPVLAFRLASPALLVDLRKVPGLDRIDIGANGVQLGARVRWCDIQAHTRLAQAHPLLVAAIAHVAHYQIRNRGTVGGSLAHADPSAEMPGIAVACDATIVIRGPAGERTVKAENFFTGSLSTVLADDELIVQLRLPAWPAERRWAFEEFSRRRGDFAIAGVAVHYDLDAAGRAKDAHVGVIGACTQPHRVPQAEAILNGRPIDMATAMAAAKAAAAAVEPTDDIHASAEYRRALVETLVERALRRAASPSMKEETA